VILFAPPDKMLEPKAGEIFKGIRVLASSSKQYGVSKMKRGMKAERIAHNGSYSLLSFLLIHRLQ
jgi:hypothetical protein